MSRKKSIEEINQITSETMDALNPKFEEFNKLCNAIVTNHNEFPRCSKFSLGESKDFAHLSTANEILREANTKIDDKFVNSHANESSYKERYDEATKKSAEITTDYPEVSNRLPMVIIFLVIGLAFIGFYIVGNILKLIEIPLDPSISNIIWIAIIILGAIFFILGALFGIFFIINMSAMYADLKDRLHEAKMLRKNSNALMEEMEARIPTLDNALKAMILVEDACLQQIAAIPEDGAVFLSIKECIGGAVTLIYQKRAHDVADAINIITNELRIQEMSEILLAQQRALTSIIKELRIQNKVAVAAFTGNDLEL